MNVDPREINKFASLSHEWWSKDGAFKTLHQINPLRISFIEHCLKDIQNLSIVDVGCGGGILTEALAKKAARVTGIDMAASSLEAAKRHAEESGLNINYRHTTAEIIADDQPGKFDGVSCMEMLEHVPEPKSVIRACSKLAKKHGWVFFSTLNRNLKSYLLSVIIAEYFLKLIPIGTHKYKKFIRPSELVDDAKECNLCLRSIKGIRYRPFIKQFSIVDNVDVNYIIAFQKT